MNQLEDQNNLVKRDFVNGVGILSLNRPNALNALDAQLFNTLLSQLSIMEADPHIACIILTGEGRTFCVGADIKYMAESQAEIEQVVQFLGKFDQVANTSKPLIACVNGAALGGMFFISGSWARITSWRGWNPENHQIGWKTARHGNDLNQSTNFSGRGYRVWFCE